jgi:predicted NBD/HSP70 family sugar kinase
MWGTLADLVAAARRGDEVVVGVGCGGPMARGGVTVSPLNIPAWREFPLRARLGDLTGPRSTSTTTPRPWPGRGLRRARARSLSHGCLDRGGRGIVVDGRLLDGPTATPGTSATSSWSPTAPCAPGARGCLEAEASGPSILASGAWSRRRSERTCAAPGCCGRALASVVNLLDLRLAVVGGSVASASGPRSSRPPRPSSTPAPASSTPAAPASSPWAWRRGPRRCRRGGLARPRPGPVRRRGPRLRTWSRDVGEGAAVNERRWALAAAAAVAASPLWLTRRQALVLAAPGWWRRAPFLPLPSPSTCGSGSRRPTADRRPGAGAGRHRDLPAVVPLAAALIEAVLHCAKCRPDVVRRL